MTLWAGRPREKHRREGATQVLPTQVVPSPQRPSTCGDCHEMVAALSARDMATILRIYQQWTGATQPQIANAVGIDQPSVSAILNGRRQVTAPDTLERFADGLAIPRQRLGLAAVPGRDSAAESAGVDSSPYDGARVVEQGADYPPEAATPVDLLARLAGANLSNDPMAMRSRWSPTATPGRRPAIFHRSLGRPKAAGTATSWRCPVLAAGANEVM
ncbi:helix-turn-helix domain-containing protein [Frankia sp. AgB1.9]|uniref:helix-turn-helix domain-containing protein n=1 Tax=unclassified Frankia TaxID=2632575 RepID=UPI001932C62E|nr:MULTISPECIES: helix-turn-helix transcriptional regulator [unclassified Frankia]MBL7487965.1 helix-turn-helix domain-containing protein [Frankia sp. AgW1.1]MBL7550408.1 helix-turn-helix domain-containing protein [Frankia sp. AgB1.9]MBL7620878.1 helix-turn-helix domain-containing protein [Frankia sp. AgB1.8]